MSLQQQESRQECTDSGGGKGKVSCSSLYACYCENEYLQNNFIYIYIYSAFQVVQQASINVNCYGRVKGDTRN